MADPRPNTHSMDHSPDGTRPLVVGLTGGIAAGKSLVGRMFEALGLPVWNADNAAKQLYATDAPLREAMVERWGDDIGAFDGAGNLVDIDRQALAQIVFNDAEELNWLEQRVHPAVGRAFEKWVAGVQRDGCAEIVVREAAILFESKSDETCDMVVTVEAPLDLRISRALSRKSNAPIKKEDILKRVQQQWQPHERMAKANHVIENDGNTPLLPQVLALAGLIRRKVG
ncbi:dephospho-CoA kinase [Flavobacteriales bacterium]|nr:dephospho-CoA kinase [Flavobacteriales bacterium]